MKLYVVRHGESIGNIKQGFISGRTDTEGLTEKGRKQIVRSAWNLQSSNIEHIYSSPVARAHESATIIHSLLGGKMHCAKWLSELDHGIFEGHYWWEVIDKIPVAWRKNREDYHSAYPGGGESMKDLGARVSKGIQNLLSNHSKGDTIVLVTHQAVCASIRYILLFGNPEIDEKGYISYIHKHTIPNASIIELCVSNNVAEWSKDHTSLPQVESSKKSVLFYMQSITKKHESFEIVEKETASRNNVYRVTSKNNDFLFKLVSKKTQQEVQRMYTLYKYLEKLDFPSPRVIHFDDSTIFFPYSVLVTDYVAGHTQSACLKSHPSIQSQTLLSVFQSIQKIHALPIRSVKDFWKPPGEAYLQSWRQFMHLNINYTLHYVDEWLKDDSQQKILYQHLSSLRRYILHGRYEIVPIHGDFSPGNLIVSEKKCSLLRVIDFEWARMGDALWDFAYYWGWLDRIDLTFSKQWEDIVAKHISSEKLNYMKKMRLLFHAWTVRDMFDYEDNTLRLKRGKKSQQILSNMLRD